MSLALDLNAIFQAVFVAALLGVWASLRGELKELKATALKLLLWREGQEKDTKHLAGRIDGHAKACNQKLDVMSAKLEELEDEQRKQN